MLGIVKSMVNIVPSSSCCMCLLCSLLKNKSNKGHRDFGKGLVFTMQNIRDRGKPPHRFLLNVVPPLTPSRHSLCLPQPFFSALRTFPGLFLSITVVRTAAARKCPRNYFMLKKHQLNVSEICRNIIGKETLPHCLPACYSPS